MPSSSLISKTRDFRLLEVSANPRKKKNVPSSHLLAFVRTIRLDYSARREFLREIPYKNIAIIAIQHSKMYFVDTFGDFLGTTILIWKIKVWLQKLAILKLFVHSMVHTTLNFANSHISTFISYSSRNFLDWEIHEIIKFLKLFNFENYQIFKLYNL